MCVGLLELCEHCCLFLLQLLRYLVYVLSILVSFRDTCVVKVLSTFIILAVCNISIILGTFFHLVQFLGISLLILSHFQLILVDILPNFILKLFYLGPCLSIVTLNSKLILIDIIFSLSSVLVKPLPIADLFLLHFSIHLLFHQKLLMLLLVHLGNELSFPLGVPNPFLSPFLFFGELDQSGLEGHLLVSHHLKVVFGLHHVGLGTVHA